MTRRRWGFAAAAMLCVVAGVSPARAQAVHHTIATLALQHGVIGIEALSTGHVLIGASTDAGNATVSLAADAPAVLLTVDGRTVITGGLA